MKIEQGVMVMKEGKAWGVAYDDHQARAYGWIDLEEAEIHDPRFCKKPTDVTYTGSPHVEELKTAKVVHVIRKTTVVIIK